MSEEDYLGIHMATVDGKSLTKALRKMKRVRGRKMGSAFWSFGDNMEIAWSGMQFAVEGEVFYQLPHDIMVSARFMRHSGDRLTYEGPTDICWEKGDLCIGFDRVPAEEAPTSRPFALLVDANEGDLLREVLGRSTEAAVQSGYGEELEPLEEKLGRTMGQAAKALAWTGMSEERLTNMVMGALTEDARTHVEVFESGDVEEVTERPAEVRPGPRWEFPTDEEHVDLISYKRSGLVYLYRWQLLEQQGIQGPELQDRFFRGLADLGAQNKRLRERAFTVFVGDYGSDFGGYAIAISTTNGEVSNFLRQYLPKTGLSGPSEGDIPLLSPLFRYDHGHLIRYTENELAGTTYIDDEEWSGTGKTIYRRGTWSTDSKSQYGKLIVV
jgi:hypothetical protein